MRLLPFVVGLVIVCIGLGSLVGNLVLNLRARRAGAPTSRERLVLEAQRRSVAAGRATAAQVALAAATRRSASLAKLDKRMAALERMAGGGVAGRGGAVVALGRDGGVPFTGREYIEYPPSLQLRASGQQQQRAGTTVTAWVRLESEATVINTIFATRLPGCNGNGAAHLGISLAVNSWQTADQQLVAEWGVGGGSGASSVAPSCARLASGAVNVVPRDRWAHVALVIAAAGSTLYLDGDAVATQGAGVPAPLQKQQLLLLREREREGGKARVAGAPLPFTVGAHAGGGSPFGGHIARLCVWDGAMTAADVRAEIGLLRAGGALAVPGYPLGNVRLLASLLSDAKAPGKDATGTNKDGVAHGFERPWDRQKVHN